MTTTRVRRLLGLAATVATAIVALGASMPANADDGGLDATLGSLLGCGDTISHPFGRFFDPLPYTLAPGGTFEDGAAGWTLHAGARVVSGNESFALSGPGSKSLYLPEGSSATSPPMCVGLVLPIVRFVSTGGELLSALRVEVLYADAAGGQHSIDLLPGALPTGSRWVPTLPLLQLGGLLNALTLNGLTTDVRFRFTPRGVFGGGNWRIDDIYVDPWKSS